MDFFNHQHSFACDSADYRIVTYTLLIVIKSKQKVVFDRNK